jgi:hypothetical protein
MKKTLLIILYCLFCLQLTIALFEYVDRNGKFFGVADYMESFFLDNKVFILTASIIVTSVLLLVSKLYRPNRRHMIMIVFILFVEFIKTLSNLLNTGSWSSWWL